MSPKKSKSQKNILQAPKGMRDLLDDPFYMKQGFYEKAQEIAEYYGFSGIELPILEHEEIFTKGVGDGTDIVDKEMYSLKTKGGDHLVMRPEGTAAAMRAYIEHGMGALPQPVFIYYDGPFFRHERPQKGRYRQFYQFGLEIIGSPKAVLDAITIQTGYQILKESGKDISVKINTLGDTEVRKEYLRELKSFYKKHKNSISQKDLKRLETNPLRVLDSKEADTIAVNEDAPTLIETLNKESKKHFKQVLEYLDAAHIPYEIDNTLVRGLDYYAHTVFEYVTYSEDGETSLALGGGGRYDGLAKVMGHTKDVPAVGLALGVDRIIEIAKEGSFNPKIRKKPKFFFIQIGYEAKAKAFDIIEIMRKKRYPLKHSLSKNNLGKQLAKAEESGIPYALIFGKKEAIDGTVIVRDMRTRKQKTVDIPKLADYIKTLK
ncbi:MAG: histidine--tRNA ligase [Candidatus Pacebacteria bacterium]|nr:histidine--tRNA ligase [Candidatus Paceibacterota bacterium]